MSVANELADYSFLPAPIMSLTWIPHSPTSSSAYRLLTPQSSPYSSPKLHSSSSVICPEIEGLEVESTKRRNTSRKVSKPSYKHIPHKDKPPHLVARRNARERKRVQAVNSAFAKLRKCVPLENRNKRLSKVKTLHRAIEYINGLQALLRQSEDHSALPNSSVHYSRHFSESYTSKEDNHLDDDGEDDDEDDRERDIRGFNEFEDYLESDIEVVNKENESRAWGALSTGCEPSYWSCVPYHGECGGNIPS